VEHAPQLPSAFPWRTAAVAAAAVALAELVALVALGAVHLVHPFRHHVAAKPKPVVAQVHRVVHVRPIPPVPTHPLIARTQVSVLVLNGNNVQGAAHVEASRLQALGYRIGGAANATRHDYAQSMVMYVSGYVQEARRLARDTHIRMVAPLDGLTPRTLRASKLVVLLGN
jgi:hypothetical protein